MLMVFTQEADRSFVKIHQTKLPLQSHHLYNPRVHVLRPLKSQVYIKTRMFARLSMWYSQ